MLKSVLILIFTTAHVCGYLREDCVCGVANTESRRITNGNVVKPFRYPWMVAIFNAHKKAFCGGSLISDRHVIKLHKLVSCTIEKTFFGTSFQVLTAAHCVSWEKYKLHVLLIVWIKNWNCLIFSRFAPNYWRYLYGKIKSHHIDYGEGMNFDAIFVHPKFKSHGTFDDYDLAILRFRLAIRNFSKKVRPICVPSLSELLRRWSSFILWSDYKMITVEGWKQQSLVGEHMTRVLCRCQHCSKKVKSISFIHFNVPLRPTCTIITISSPWFVAIVHCMWTLVRYSGMIDYLK